jgi:FO synthase
MIAAVSDIPDSIAAGADRPISDAEALALAEIDLDGPLLPALLAAATARRDRAWGKTITFSPKVFLPLTNLCRNICDYCSFRRSPRDPGAHTMSPDELRAWLDRARAQGCIEALFCLGDRPESGFPDYRRQLRDWGFTTTVEYLRWAGELALECGLLPHTNAGVLSRAEMQQIAPVNVSLGLMLESTSERLCARGMPHFRAPDKRPAVRLQMTREAGELGIPFTSGLLLGIGESRRERIETLLAIRDLHRTGRHIQEVIVQRFRAGAETAMAGADEPADRESAHAIALARLILDDDVSVQAPPNLSPDAIGLLIGAGINDLGGISPVTPDFINPGHPWPHLARLAELCSATGFTLAPRLPVYDSHLARPGAVDPALAPHITAARARMHEVLAGASATRAA